MWWIGGAPCSGKSTVARAVAARRGWSLYSCDEAFERHAAGVDPAQGPVLKKVTTISVHDRLSQQVSVQLRDVHQLCSEEFPLILDDLADRREQCVVEGAALLPRLLRSIGVPEDKAVWMVPTPDFQALHYERRDWARAMVAELPDPGGAFARWMVRDALFAADIAAEARELGYRVIVVDGAMQEDETLAMVLDALTPA